VTLDLEELDRRLVMMVSIVRAHLIEKWPEKGGWRDEDPRDRADGLAQRAANLGLLARYEAFVVEPNDDDSPRTVPGELVKLLSSAFILGDEYRLWGKWSEAWPS